MISRRKIGFKLFLVSLVFGGFLSFNSSVQAVNSSVQAVKVDWVAYEDWQEFLEKIGTCPAARAGLEQFLRDFLSDSDVKSTLLRTDRPPITNVQPVVDSQEEMDSLMAAHQTRNVRFAESKALLESESKDIELITPGHSYVIHPKGKHSDVVVRLAQYNWFTSDKGGRRYQYQGVSRIAYHLQIQKVIDKYGIKRVKTADMFFVFTDPSKSNQEPTDDTIALVSTFIDADRSREAFTRIYESAKKGDEGALELLKDLILVIRWAGLWDISENNLLLEKSNGCLMAVVADYECPGIGGNPWRWENEAHEKKIKQPWLDPNPDFIKAGSGMGMRELITMLFDIPKAQNGQSDVLALADKFIDFAESDDPSTENLKNIIS